MAHWVWNKVAFCLSREIIVLYFPLKVDSLMRRNWLPAGLNRLGDITFDIPQVRCEDFYPQALEKGLRSERALMTPALHQTQCGASVALAAWMIATAFPCRQRTATALWRLFLGRHDFAVYQTEWMPVDANKSSAATPPPGRPQSCSRRWPSSLSPGRGVRSPRAR
jgi:hypothetical protein